MAGGLGAWLKAGGAVDAADGGGLDAGCGRWEKAGGCVVSADAAGRSGVDGVLVVLKVGAPAAPAGRDSGVWVTGAWENAAGAGLCAAPPPALRVAADALSRR